VVFDPGDTEYVTATESANSRRVSRTGLWRRFNEANRGPFSPAAAWPEGGNTPTSLSGVAEFTLAERRGIDRQFSAEAHSGACPGQLPPSRWVSLLSVAVSRRVHDQLVERIPTPLELVFYPFGFAG
jgi:hypothetical protein